jgi:hypothetical protein
MLMFGLLELFRATHLSHHRWLNSPGDSAHDNQNQKTDSTRVKGVLASLEVTQHLKFYWEALHGLHAYAKPRRIAFCAALTGAWIIFWFVIGRPDMVWKLMALTAFTTTVPVSLRGAIEHHGEPGAGGFANEYRTLIPLFNLNRHVIITSSRHYRGICLNTARPRRSTGATTTRTGPARTSSVS